jgi:hypothetical protein
VTARLVLIVTTVLCFPSSSAALQEINQQALDKTQALSLLKACRESASAIVRGDCLIKHEYGYDTLQRSLPHEIAEKEEGRSFWRVAFDFENEKFLLVVNSLSRKTAIQPDLSNEKDSELIFEKLYGAITDRETGYRRTLPDPKFRFDHKNGCGLFLEDVAFPDLRMVGSSFSIRRSPLFTKRDQDEANWISIAENFESIESLGSGKVRLSFSFDIPYSTNNKKYVHITNAEIDSERFVFLMVANEVREKETGKFISRGTRQRYEWIEHEGMYLPHKIFSTEGRFVNVNGKEVAALVEKVQTIHWFSCNEELDEALFDHSILDDSTEMLRLADPKATKAKTFDDQDD